MTERKSERGVTAEWLVGLNFNPKKRGKRLRGTWGKTLKRTGIPNLPHLMVVPFSIYSNPGKMT